MSRTQPDRSPAVRIEAENEWAWCGDRRLELTPKAFAVLRHLLEHAGRLVTKDELLSTIWRDAVVSDAALASVIRDVRKALGDASHSPRYVQTVHRRGFRFIGPVARAAAPIADETTSPSDAASMLVGRESELAGLHARLKRALAGERQLVFVTGEPGIGKTTLVEAFLADVGEAGVARIGHGQCVEQYGAGEAYLPILEALGRLGRASGSEALLQMLKQHAPTWLEQLPGLLSDREMAAVQRRAQGATRGRMLRELAEALDALTRDAPLVLLLEDLHWSDSATIDLLGMLARRREASRLLVLGTYRPAEVAGAPAHPLRWIKHELQLHGHCDEIPLAFLSAAAVGEYICRRFPKHALPGELALVLHRNTEGNPLFLVNTVDDLIGQGQLREIEGQWQLYGPAEDIAARPPDTLWQLVERQVERLTADERTVLMAASVAGVEFSAAAVVPETIDPPRCGLACEALARRGQLLRAAGVAEWPDGTVAERYAFIHALYQQVLYQRVPVGERGSMHLRTAERLERGYGERASEIAGGLAVHFEQGKDVERATRYRRLAGEHALRQHAYREAADHARRALDMLEASPGSAQRSEQELSLEIMLGAALAATQGYAAPEAARSYARAWALCAQMGETPQLLPVLVGLGRYYLVRGEFQTAHAVATHLMAVAEATHDRALLLAAHNSLGVVSFYTGRFAAAHEHLEQGLALCESDVHGPNPSPAIRLVPSGVSCAIHGALTLWMLGYPDRAVTRAREGLALARSLEHPFSVSYACHHTAGLHEWRRESQAMHELEEEALPLDTDHGFEFMLTAGIVHRGWLLFEGGQGDGGLARMQEGLARHRAIGAGALVPAFLAFTAEAYRRLGRPAEGLAAITEALTALPSGLHYWEAELHRLSGELQRELDVSPQGDAAAESELLRAIEIARRQGARSLELRASTSLGRLWGEQGKLREAQALLSGIHDWFTEGFESGDLREARALLEELTTRAEGSGGMSRGPRPPGVDR